MLEFFRSMGIPANAYPSDKKMVDNIKKWCEKITLGGNTFNLEIKDESIFQIASQTLYSQKYGIYIYDKDILDKIVINSKYNKVKFKQKTGYELHKQKIVCGILVLYKYAFYQPEPSKKFKVNGYNSKRFVIGDCYRLYLFNDKFLPIATVLASGITPVYYFDLPFKPHNTLKFFPEADDLVVSWHELASILQVNKTGIYSAACFSEKYGFGYGSIAIYGISESDQAELIFSALGGGGIELDKTLNENYNYTDVERKKYKSFVAANTFSPGEISLPTPRLSSGSNAEKAIIKFFMYITSGRQVCYLSEGYFLIKEAELKKLAAGTNNWGSLETTGFTTTAGEGAALTASEAAAIMGVVSFIATAKALASSDNAGDFLEEGRKKLEALGSSCSDMQSEEDCMDCYKGAYDDLVSAQDAGDSAVTSGAIGAMTAPFILTTPLGWIGLVVVAGIAIYSIVVGHRRSAQAGELLDKIHQDCNKAPATPIPLSVNTSAFAIEYADEELSESADTKLPDLRKRKEKTTNVSALELDSSEKIDSDESLDSDEPTAKRRKLIDETSEKRILRSDSPILASSMQQKEPDKNSSNTLINQGNVEQILDNAKLSTKIFPNI